MRAEGGEQTSYPTFTPTVPNNSFRNPTPLDVPNPNGILSLPRSISPFPSESPSPPLSGLSVLPPTVASLPDPEEPELAGNLSLDTSLV